MFSFDEFRYLGTLDIEESVMTSAYMHRFSDLKRVFIGTKGKVMYIYDLIED